MPQEREKRGRGSSETESRGRGSSEVTRPRRRFSEDLEEVHEPKALPPRRASGKTSGWDILNERAEQAERRKEERMHQLKEFKLQDGEDAEIQFLHDDPAVYDLHTVMVDGKFRKIPCQLATQKRCAMCDAGVRQSGGVAFKIVDFRGNWDSGKKDYKWDVGVEKIWIMSMSLAKSFKTYIDKKGIKASEAVFNISRSGAKTDTRYNFELATDNRGKILEPEEIDEVKESIYEAIEPPTNEELEALNFTIPDDDDATDSAKPRGRRR